MKINRFSIVASVYGVERYLDDFFASVVNQTISFKNHIELIVVDDGSLDGSADIIKKWQKFYPDNIKYIYKENGGLSSARNMGLQHVTTKWVSFIDPDDFISDNYFEAVDLFLLNSPQENIGLISCNYIYYIESEDRASDSHPLNFRFKQQETVLTAPDLEDFFQVSVNAVLLRVDVIRENKLEMDERVKPNFEDGHFSGRYLLAITGKQVVFLKDAKYYYRKREDGSSLLDTSWGNPEQYDDKLRFGGLSLLKYAQNKSGDIPIFIQRLVLYDLFWHIRYLVNHKERISFLGGEQKKNLLFLVKEIFSYIDIDVVDHFNIAGCWFYHKVGMLGAFKGEALPFQIVYVDSFDPVTKLLKLRFFYSGLLESEVLFLDDKEIAPYHSKTRRHDFIDATFVNERFVWVRTPNLSESINIQINNLDTRLSLNGKHYYDGLSVDHVCKEFEKKELEDLNFPPSVRLLRKLARHPATSNVYENAWLFMDRDTQADDNAEHLYRYVSKNHPDINAFFILRKDSYDWQRLKDEGFKLLDFTSRSYKLALLNAIHLISSQADQYVTNFLENKWFGDILQYKYTFLQHGITKDDISNWLNPKEIDLFITGTEQEYSSIATDGSKYKFSSKEVSLTGFPRHDALLEMSRAVNAENLIVIMPTWREQFVGKVAGKGNYRSENKQFYSSVYAQSWKSFLHSKELRQLAESQGYSVVFSPHVNVQPYVDWFEVPDYIKTLPGNESGSIQSLFCRAKLLVTDYSSVAFEAAYLFKSVVYYQFDYDDIFGGMHTTNEGYYEYEADGFGPVCYDLNKLFEEISLILNNDSIPTPQFLERMERTFKYRDGLCCQRVYEKLVQLNG